MTFSLPPDITFKQQTIDGGMAYTFRHKTLGELGRIILKDAPGGQCQITSEVVGDPSDPMTDTRLKIFQPLSEQLTTALDAAMGSRGVSAPPAATAPGAQEAIASTLIPCERCGQGSALLIFADRAQDVGGLEDYARKMYSKYKELNLPTWIIGPPMGVPSDDTPAMTMKVWPERQAVQRLSPNAFNAQLDNILKQHCR